MSLHTRALEIAPSSLNDKERTCDFVASTDAVDSYDEIVDQDWILDRFNTNPVILFAHNSRELPIGTAVRCEVLTVNGRRQLECTIKFATAEANPVAENVWQSVRQRTLRAVSVGFMPGECRFEKRAGREVYVLSQNELREISVCSIPANPEALAKMHGEARERAVDDNNSGRTDALEETGQMDEKTKALLEQREREATDAKTKAAELVEKNAEMSLKLKDEAARAEKAEAELATLRTEKTAREEKAATERVEEAFATYKDDRKLTDADKEAMAIVLRSKPETFEKQYPKVGPNDRHLLRTLTGNGEQERHAAATQTAPVTTVRKSVAQLARELQAKHNIPLDQAQRMAQKQLREQSAR